MSDGSKSMVWQAEYQPWGAVQSLSGPLTLDLRFPGQWFQLEAGLHYNWHRHYDPSLGRYTQPDPLGFVDGPSVYGYAGGDPLRHIDPEGRYLWLLTPAARCAANPTCRTLVINYCKRKLKEFWKDESGGKSSKQRRKEWEERNNQSWPKDPETGNNQDVHHDIPSADEGPDTVDNYRPMTRRDHIQHHKDRGDFSRWGSRRWKKG